MKYFGTTSLIMALVFLMIGLLGGPVQAVLAAEKPEIFVQLGHAGMVKATVISPDGTRIATGDVEGNIRLWDADSGREIRSFRAFDNVAGLRFTPDGTRLFASGYRSVNLAASLWYVRNGQEIKQFDSQADMSPDGKTIQLWSGQLPGEVTHGSWDVATGKEGEQQVVLFPEDSREYAFSSDGKLALVVSTTGRLFLFDVRAGKVLKWFVDTPDYASQMKYIRGAFHALFSPDNRRIITWSSYSPFPGEPPVNYVLETWDAGTGKKITLRGHSDRIESVIFSPDRTQIASAGMDGSIRLWDATTGKLLKIVVAPETNHGDKEWFVAISFSADGRYLLSASHDAKLWDCATGKLLKTFTGFASASTAAIFSPDGSRLAFGNHEGMLGLLDLRNGSVLQRVGAHQVDTLSLAISPDGSQLLSGGIGEPQLKRWSFPGLIEQASYAGHASRVISTCFSPDGQRAASGGDDGILKIWNIKDGAAVASARVADYKVYQCSFSSDNTLIRTVGLMKTRGDNSRIAEWGINGLQFRHDLGAGLLAPDRTHALVVEPVKDPTSAPQRTYHLLNLASKKQEGSFAGIEQGVLAFSPVKKLLLVNDYDKSRLIFYDATTGKNWVSSSAHTAPINSADITPDGTRAVSTSDDGTIRLWNTADGREIARLITFTDGEWIIITPQGYYNASLNGENNLNVRLGEQVHGIANYRETFYRPDLVTIALNGGSLESYRSLADIKPPPNISFVQTPSSATSEEFNLTLKLSDQGGGIGDVRLFLNGTAVMLDNGRSLKAQQKNNSGAQYVSYTLKLTPGNNTIKAIAFNADNSMQSNDAIHQVAASFTLNRKPILYALVLGIQEFRNPRLQLKYAVADAKLFTDTLRASAAGLFQQVRITTLTSREATSREAIEKALNEYRTINPEDLFILYVASHGTVDEGEYFLITSNIGSLSSHRLRTDALSQAQLKRLVANIPSTKKLILLDTCNAAALGDAIQASMLTRGMSEDTAMKILSRAVGSTILSAATSTQEALEGYQGHGLFTWALVQGLLGKADKGQTGFIKTTDLAAYVEDVVPDLAEKVFKRAQFPTISISGQGFPVGKVR